MNREKVFLKILKPRSSEYTKAAAQGNAQALNNLGWMTQTGEGVASDPVKAGSPISRGCRQRVRLLQVNLGWLYQNGQGVPKDLSQAISLYQKAADQEILPLARQIWAGSI